MSNKPLTKAQDRVMPLMSRRWPASVAGSGAIHINGERVCNIATMTVLERFGLVEKDTRWTWKATPEGLAWPVHQ